MKFRGVVAVEHRGTAAVDPAVRDDAVDQIFVLGTNVALVDVLAEEPLEAGKLLKARWEEMAYSLRMGAARKAFT